MVTPEPVTVEHMPSVESRSGTNGYYHPCEPYGGSPNYGVCLFTLQANNDKRLPDGHPCSVAIQAGQCPAVEMQRREWSEGRALYYIDRRVLEAAFVESRRVAKAPEIDRTDYESESYKRGFAVLDKPIAAPRVGRKPVTKIKRASKRDSGDLIAPGQDYAAALNKAQHKAQPMSLLEVARRMQANKELK